MSKLTLKKIALDEVIPYWRNVRDNNDYAVAMTAKSIERYGYQSPILVDKNNTIIAGHTRYKAMRKLGVTEVVVLVSDMDEKKAKEYRVVDNRTQEYSNWVIDRLMEEYQSLPDIGLMEEFFPVLRADGTPDIPTDDGEEEQKVELVDGDYVELLCPNCMNGFELTWREMKGAL